MLSENEFITKYNLSELDINNQKLLYKSYKKK